MKKYILFVLIFLHIFSNKIFAQQIKGQVKSNNLPIIGASVNLLKHSDSSLVKAALSNDSGYFSIPFSHSGQYILLVQALGYDNYYSSTINLGKNNMDIPVVELIEKKKDIDNVTVTTQKPFIQQQIDKTIVNIANSVTAVGSNVWEVLDKVPGVIVDNSNNAVSLQGKSGVMIYIDGKPTYLSGDQLANLLKGMEASNIQNIEVMAHPPAQYDAAGNAGIINIVTKKSKVKGLNGSLSAEYGQGRFARHNYNGTFNYRNGKLNVYGNLGMNKGKNWNSNKISREFEASDVVATPITSIQNAYNIYKWEDYSYKLGVDYYLDSANTIGVIVNGDINPNNSYGSNTTNFSSMSQLDSSVLTGNTDVGRWTSITYDLNYKHDFKKEGSYIIADFTYAKFHNRSIQEYDTRKYDDKGNLLQNSGLNPFLRQGNLPSLIDIKTGKLDYVLPIGAKVKFSAGWKSSFVTSDNNAQYYNWINDSWTTDVTVTNHFKYKENINAGYINLNKEFQKGWSIQLGLRGEQTVSNGHQYIGDSTVKRNYFQLFPTIFIQKKVGENNTYGLTYNRRVTRPDYEDLNPFLYYLDPYVYSQGNPFLQPQIANSVEASYSFKSILVASINYAHTNKLITDILRQNDATRVTYQTKDNLGKKDNISINVSVNIPVTKWWTSNNNINAFRNIMNGSYLGEPVQLRKNTISYNATNTFTLPKGFKAELSGFYHSALVWGLFNIRSQYQANIGIQKNILKDNATIKVNVNDIFRTNRSRADVIYGNINTSAYNRWDSRRVNISLTWRFKKGENVKSRTNNESGAQEEQSRIKSK